ncbi:hypothetical protein B566_EDAN011766 [Ephemera danica]|nr:hypothetical protein B566_EDAN011766 [Ephemera danica]
MIACGPPCTYGTHIHQHLFETKGKHVVVQEANTRRVKSLIGKIKRCFSTSQLSEEEANQKFSRMAQMRCHSSNGKFPPREIEMYNVSKRKASESSDKPSLQAKRKTPSPIAELGPASPEFAVPAVPEIFVVPASPETSLDTPSIVVTPSAASPASTGMATREREVPAVSERTTPASSEVPRQPTPMRAGSSNSPAVVTCWGSPEKTKRRNLAEQAPPASTLFTLEQEDSLRSSALQENNTVPHQTPRLTSRKSSYPGSLGNRSGRSQRCNLGNKSNSNRRGQGTAKKNLMKTYGNQTDWRENPAFAKVNEELRAERQRKAKAAKSKRKPRQKKQGKCAEKASEQTAETSRSGVDTCEESCVQPEVDHLEVPYSRPMTRGARLARRRAITNYEGGVAMVKAVFNVALNDNEEPQVNGMVNLGVTCFLNSNLQCLAQSPLFLNELIRTFDEQTIQLPGDPSKGVERLQVSLDTWGPVTHNLAQVLANIPVSSTLEEPVKPDVLVQVLDQQTEMNFNNQQDAQELLIILLDTLREEYELTLGAKMEEAIKPRFTSKEDANRVLQIYEQQARREAAFGPTVLFQGLVTSTIRCDTLKDSVARSESFTTLSLPIASSRKRRSVDMPLSPTKRSMDEENFMNMCDRYANLHPKLSYEQLNPLGDAGKKMAKQGTEELEPVEEDTEDLYTLHSCLQQFMAAQCMTDYDCSCKKRPKGGGTHTMQTEIIEAPRILVLHLKRFRVDDRRNIQKINIHVSFPSLLDISDFCDAKCRDSGNTVYSLYAVLHHSGTPTGGHYIADVKVRHPRHLASGTNPEECQWYVMDDQNVTKTSESSVLGRQAYLLFYERLDN